MRKLPLFVSILLLVIILNYSCSKEDYLKPVDDVCEQMEDVNFMRYCYEQFDVNKDGVVSMTEAASVSSMNAVGKTIRSLKGIEYFFNLTELDISSNPLTNLDISKLTKLTSLTCESTLSELKVVNHPYLKSLTCGGDRLNSLVLDNLPQLTTLYCRYSNHPNINLDNLPQLVTLSFYGNTMASLDVENLPNLTDLYCFRNSLTSLSVHDLPQLTSLSCDNNALTRLDLNNLPQLRSLSCGNNNLTSLDVSNLNLSVLFCSDNPMTTLYLRIGQSIEWLSKPQNCSVVYK